MEKIEVNDKLLSAISYFSSIGGEFASFSPTQTVEGEKFPDTWSWHSANGDDALEPGYWLNIYFGINGVTAKIIEEHTPSSVLYQAIGYCKYHGIAFDII